MTPFKQVADFSNLHDAYLKACRAKREIQLLLEGYSMKKAFIIGRVSESGKSTLGRYLDQRGIKRLKIAFFLKRAMEREGVKGDFVEWNNQNMKERPEWVFRTLIYINLTPTIL